MLDVFLDVVLPVFLIAVVGGQVARWRGVTVPALSATVFYLFGPALVFDAMANNELSASLGAKIFAVIVLVWITMFTLAHLWSRLRRHDTAMRAGFVLAATSANAGNMGLPVARLAFGDVGLQVAVLNMIVGAVLTNSAGLAVASAAGGDARAALKAPFKYPYMYAALLGILVQVWNVDLPTTIATPIETLAGATIPVMLVVLGLQLRSITDRDDMGDTIAINVGRLLFAPGVAWLLATAFGLDGVQRGTLTILAAMPVAVVTTILAAQFGARADFVTRVVITSTLASVVTLTVLIGLVR